MDKPIPLIISQLILACAVGYASGLLAVLYTRIAIALAAPLALIGLGFIIYNSPIYSYLTTISLTNGIATAFLFAIFIFMGIASAIKRK